MIYKQISINLYKNLVICDFYLAKKTLFKMASKAIYAVNKYQSVAMQDLQTLIVAFKQLLKIVFFMLKRRFIKSSLTVLHIENGNAYELVRQLQRQKKLPRFKIINETRELTMVSFQKINFFFSVGEYNKVINYARKTAYLLYMDVFLIFNSYLRTVLKYQGTYKMSAELDSFKKIIFIFLLFKKLNLIKHMRKTKRELKHKKSA